MTKITKDKSKQRFGDENGRFDGGKSSDYRRRVAGAKKGEIVHHKDENKANNTKANFKIIKPKKGMNAIGVHNEEHPEKAIKGGKVHAKKIKGE